LQAAMNPGAVFGLFRGQWLFLVVFTIIALSIMAWVLFRSKNASKMLLSGLGIVCAGALGNLWDRLLYDAVRDFIVFKSTLLPASQFPGHQWPTFNLADAWICVGIPLILLADFLAARREKAEAKAVKKEVLESVEGR
jgi:signal peptidase II